MAAAMASCIGLLILQLGLWRVFSVAPQLQPPQEQPLPETSLTVVIPAYNEAENIALCLESVLRSAPPCVEWQALVVDDESSDATAALAAACAADHPHTSAGFSRCRPDRVRRRNDGLARTGPAPGRWSRSTVTGCCSSMPMCSCRPMPCSAPAQAISDQADLLSLAPRLTCGSLAEWMVQPIMASQLGLGFPIEAANDPASDVAFAAGPFMLFRRSVYQRIGGHRVLAAEVVEDLALARTIKAGGHRLRYLLGLDAVDLHMYADLAALWEGWTKNWCLGLDRDPAKALAAAGVVVVMFSIPWLLLPVAIGLLLALPPMQGWWLALLTAALVAVGQQLILRLWTRQQFQLPIDYWWLMGAGGLIVGAIGPVSVWRTLTGQGWTWKGRSLR